MFTKIVFLNILFEKVILFFLFTLGSSMYYMYNSWMKFDDVNDDRKMYKPQVFFFYVAGICKLFILLHQVEDMLLKNKEITFVFPFNNLLKKKIWNFLLIYIRSKRKRVLFVNVNPNMI